MRQRRRFLLTGAMLGALLLTGCSDAGLSDSAARELQQQVAVVRAAAERHDVTAAEQQLTELRAALDRQVAADQVDPERAAEIAAAADLVAARLDLLGADEQPDEQPDTEPPPPPELPPPPEEGDDEDAEEDDDKETKEKETKEKKEQEDKAKGDADDEAHDEQEGRGPAGDEQEGRGPAGEGPPGQSRGPGPPDAAGGPGP